MMNTRKILAGAVAAAALAVTTAYAADPAQAPGPGMWGQGGGMMGQGGGMMGRGGGMMGQGGGMMGQDGGMMGYGMGAGRGGPGGMMWRNPAAAVEGQLAALKVELKITPDQESAWKTFADKARQQAETIPARRTQMLAQRSTTEQPAPERLAQRLEFAKQRIASMEAMTAAVNDLYGALTPEQKKLADQVLARGPMHGFGGGRGHRR